MHHSLKEWGHVFKTKIHYLGNECSMFCLKGHLILVLLGDLDVVVSPTNVEFGEKRLIPQVLQGFSYIRQGVVVAYCPFIYFTVVHDDAFFLGVLFIYEVHG